MVKVVLHKDISPLVVIGHFSRPGKKPELDIELEHCVKLVRDSNSCELIVIAGDFKRPMEQMKLQADCLNIYVAQKESDVLIKHHNARNPSQNNQLDYIMTNGTFQDTAVQPDVWAQSDHCSISTLFDIEAAPRTKV